MQFWREKLLAFAIHLGLTALLALAAAGLIFLIWFPDPLQAMVGGTKLFLLVVGCDVALGPLISLVIYNSRKSRRELILDYSIVGAVQLAALVYGVYVVSNSRPVYIAFSKDQFEVVTAGEIDDVELAAAREPQYRVRPRWGAELVGIHVPNADRADALFTALDGKDVIVRPKFYVPYESQVDAVLKQAQPLSALEEKHPESAPLVDAALADLEMQAEQLRWAPVKARMTFWTALVDAATGKPLRYLPVDPY
jgi:hypothetical protein